MGIRNAGENLKRISFSKVILHLTVVGSCNVKWIKISTVNFGNNILAKAIFNWRLRMQSFGEKNEI